MSHIGPSPADIACLNSFHALPVYLGPRSGRYVPGLDVVPLQQLTQSRLRLHSDRRTVLDRQVDCCIGCAQRARTSTTCVGVAVRVKLPPRHLFVLNFIPSVCVVIRLWNCTLNGDHYTKRLPRRKRGPHAGAGKTPASKLASSTHKIVIF